MAASSRLPEELPRSAVADERLLMALERARPRVLPWLRLVLRRLPEERELERLPLPDRDAFFMIDFGSITRVGIEERPAARPRVVQRGPMERTDNVGAAPPPERRFKPLHQLPRAPRD